MIPKKVFIDRAVEAGAIDRMNQLLSGAYLLHSEANMLMQEASELMQNYNLLLGPLKQHQNAVEKTSKTYFDSFCSMIHDTKTVHDWANDIDSFDNSFRTWAKIPKNWVPSQQEEYKTTDLQCNGQ